MEERQRVEVQIERAHADHPAPARITPAESEHEKFNRMQQDFQQTKQILHEQISSIKGDRQESIKGGIYEPPIGHGEKNSSKHTIIDVDALITQRLSELEAQQSNPTKHATKGIVKTLTTSPLSVEISATDIHKKFSIPKFQLFSGTRDPVDHIFHFRQLMALYENNNALMCKVILTSLNGKTL